MRKMYTLGIIGLVILLSGCGNQNPISVTSTPVNDLGEDNITTTPTENSVYKNWNTFVNPNNGYGFLYPTNWNAAINVYNKDFALFGPGATGQSGTGGLEIRENFNSIQAYLNAMEDEVGVTHVVTKKVKIDGVDGVRVEYSGYPVKGHAVVLRKDNNIYNLYFNSNKAEDVELFYQLSESFVFAE